MHRVFKFVLPASVVCVTGWMLSITQASQTPPSHVPWAIAAWDRDVGRIIGQQATSQGPMSFAPDAVGGAWLLDQVNGRVIRFDAAGKRAGAIKLPEDSMFDDIVVPTSDSLVVLDRHRTQRVVVLGKDGKLRGETKLSAAGIDRPEYISAMLARSDGVWVEIDNHYSMRVLNRQLQTSQRQVTYGRPVLNYRSLTAAIDEQGGVVVSLAQRGQRGADRRVAIAGRYPVSYIVDYDMDSLGRVHLVTHEVQYSAREPHAAEAEQFTWIVFDENLMEVGRRALPVFDGRYDQEVETRIDGRGALWQMGFTAADVRLIHWEGVTP